MRRYWTIVLSGTLLLLPASNADASDNKIDPALVTRPAGTSLLKADDEAALMAEGERLFDSLQLSENGLTCKSCHFRFEAFEPTFRTPFPHAVGLASKRAGKAQVEADEMVQVCLVATMDSVPLSWTSRELAALTAYVLDQQKAFRERPE